ncbi:MAG: hypothetical protein JWO36_2817 [Myxococcales bacterium]|nr:hypothetical protein [Myxococcales bacterium]
MKIVSMLLAFSFVACTTDLGDDPYDDADLSHDPAVAAALADTSPETPAVDIDTVEALPAAGAYSAFAHQACTRQRFVHLANFSFVAPLECVNGVCPNGCWGYQRRTSGFSCDYDASSPSDVKTRAGAGSFASYNEIKPLNAHDDVAVASCKAQSGNRAMRTYTVWNGTNWNSEGIPASIHFAELFGSQNEATPHFSTWEASARGSYAPMSNLSPETGITMVGTKQTVAKLCAATRDGWLGLYFYDGTADSGAGMAAWKREAIISAMNYCTTH